MNAQMYNSNDNGRFIAIGYRGSAFLPQNAPISAVPKLNSWNVMSWEKYGRRRAEIIKASWAGKLGQCRQTDLCLFVSKSQWGKLYPHQSREVWIGELEKAIAEKLVAPYWMKWKGKKATGYLVPKAQWDQMLYIATDALPAGRVELEPRVDNEGYDRNSPILVALHALQLCPKNTG